MGNSQCSDLPQTSNSDNIVEMEPVDSPPEHPSTWTEPVTTPEETPDVDNGSSRARPIRGRLLFEREPNRSSTHGQKRELSPWPIQLCVAQCGVAYLIYLFINIYFHRIVQFSFTIYIWYHKTVIL